MLFVVSFLPLAEAADSAAGEVSCECLDTTCAKCETEIGVDFYTAKCGPALSKVKSCKRPQCSPVLDQETCLAKLMGASDPVRSVASTPVKSQPALDDVIKVILAVGHAKLVRGEAHIVLALGMVVQPDDHIVTADDGRVRIRFPELSEIFVSPSSDIVVTESLIEKRAGPSKRTILLNLVKGRVRSRVQGRYGDDKYGDGESKFEVKTKSAVAGVRGTDFVVSFEPGENEWKTEVRTLTGSVSLDGRGANLHVPVAGGTFATHIVPNPPSVNASITEVDDALAKGYVTAAYKMSDEDLRELDRSTDITYQAVERARAVAFGIRSPTSSETASEKSNLCRAPAGSFNQCSWTCEGNPKGSKKCQSQLPNVRCVRRLCRASGEWAESTTLPMKDGVACEANHAVVGDCGGYW